MIKLFKNITFQSIIFYTFCCLAVLILDYFFPGGSYTPGFGILIIPLTMIIAFYYTYFSICNNFWITNNINLSLIIELTYIHLKILK
jgi:hypothetical protein